MGGLKVRAMYCWDDLKAFIAVAQAGSTLAASKRLKVNQTTVARRLAALEEALDCRLFDRLQSGARLTEAGRALLDSARRVESAALALAEQASALGRQATGVVRVTTSESMANIVVAPAIALFREQRPDILIDLHANERRYDLAVGEADVAIRGGERPTERGLYARRLMETPWLVYASRDYIARHGAPERVEDIEHHQLIGWEGRMPNIPGMDWILAHAPGARIPCSCTTIANLLEVVKAGLGLAPLPAIAAGPEPDLVPLIPIVHERDIAIWLVVHESRREDPRVRAFLDFIAAYVAERQIAPRPAAFEAAA